MSACLRITRRLLAVCVVPLLIALGLTVAPAEAASVKKATNVAVKQIGDPYKYGAAGPDAFDCSGLTYFSFRKAGFKKIPRTSSAQAGFTKGIKKKKMRRGDLMFFTGSSGVYHVAIFLKWEDGKALMLHSPRSGETVKRAYAWTDSWYGGTLR